MEINTAIGDKSGLASDNGDLGNAFRNLGEYKKAIGFYEKGLEYSIAIGDKSEIAGNNENLGNAYFSLGEYGRAIKYYEKGLEINTAVGHKSGIASNNGNLGNAYRCLGEYKKAIEYCEKGLEISTAVRDKSKIASINGNLGSAYLSLREYIKAIEYCEKGLEISISIGHTSAIANNYGNLGSAYCSLGEYVKAIEYYKKGLEISTAIGDKTGIASLNVNLANAYLSSGEYVKAIEYQEKGLEITTAIEDKSGIASSNGNLGSTYLFLGEYRKAIEYYEKGLEISTSIGDTSKIASFNGNLGIAHSRIGEHRVALSYLGESIKLFDRIFIEMVPDQSKLFYAEEYIRFHVVAMECLLAIENPKHALLVIDYGRAKELHFLLLKQWKCFKKDMLEYAGSVWDRIEAEEEEGELKELESILENESYYTTVLFYAFDFQRILNVWILNKNLIHKKLDANFDFLISMIIGFLQKVNVSLGRDCSFFNLDERSNFVNENEIFHSQMPNKKPTPKCTANALPNSSNPMTLHKIFQLIFDPVKDLIVGRKLIVVPDGPLFFVPFSSLIDENECFISHNMSVQITPSLHTHYELVRKNTMTQS